MGFLRGFPVAVRKITSCQRSVDEVGKEMEEKEVRSNRLEKVRGNGVKRAGGWVTLLAIIGKEG